MKTGNLRYRVTLQQFTQIDDGGGGHTEGWADVAAVWASVDPLIGKERYEAQQIQATLSHKIKMRYRAGVKPSMRVLFGVRVFNILSPPIDPEERHRELHLLCEEVVV